MKKLFSIFLLVISLSMFAQVTKNDTIRVENHPTDSLSAVTPKSEMEVYADIQEANTTKVQQKFNPTKAGLYSAIKLAEKKVNVLLITKSNLRESNSRYAQGGIAAVMPENLEDSVELHVQDTLKAGAGLTDESVARFISENRTRSAI